MLAAVLTDDEGFVPAVETPPCLVVLGASARGSPSGKLGPSIGSPAALTAGVGRGTPPTPGNNTYPPYMKGAADPVINLGPGVGAIKESMLNALNPGALCITNYNVLPQNSFNQSTRYYFI